MMMMAVPKRIEATCFLVSLLTGCSPPAHAGGSCADLPTNASVPAWHGSIEGAKSISSGERREIESMLQRLSAAMPNDARCATNEATISLIDAPNQFYFASYPGVISIGSEGLRAILDPTNETFGRTEDRRNALAFAFAHELGHLANIGTGENYAKTERAVDEFAIRIGQKAKYDVNPGMLGVLAMIRMVDVRRGGTDARVLDSVVSFADLQLRAFAFNPWGTTSEQLCEILLMVPRNNDTAFETISYALAHLVDEPVPRVEEDDRPSPATVEESLARSAAIHAAYRVDCARASVR